MSGHSKWHSIKHKKAEIDSKRGKIFTRHANLITIAARKGGDPSMNPTLRLAIDSAKKDNVPNSNIERAIKRGTGELKEVAEIHEISYEGYGPAGIAVIAECLTDNKNRTFTNIRTIFNKKGGNLGNSGSVAWMFDRKGAIAFQMKGGLKEDIELAVIEAGADDIKTDGDWVEIYTAPSDLHKVNGALKKQGIETEKAEIVLVPKEVIKIEDPEKAKAALDFIDALEEDMDTTNVFSNFEISEELMKKIAE